MTQENKNRIEQIQRGEVPEGYKKTKVGIIPIEWETTRFKKKFNRLMRKNTEGNTNVLTISAQYGLVNQEEFFNKSVASDDKSNYYLLNRGEYAYNKSYSNGYPFGAIKRLDKYQKGVVSPLYICFSASEDNKCPDFYLQYFEAGKMNSEIQAFAQEGARNHGLLNISVDDFFNSIIVEPPLPEQKRIVEILSVQDRVIELCEKKIEELKKLKKAFLQNLFPKPGATVPEWRFPEYTDAWDQRKLLDCILKITDFRGRTPKKLGMDWSESGYLALSALNVKDGYIDFTQDVHYGDQALYDKWMSGNELHKGQVLFTTEAPMGNVAQVPNNKQYILSQRTIAFDVKSTVITENFLAIVLRSPAVFSALTALSSGGTAKGVSQKSLATVDIVIPPDLQEQEQMAVTFSCLDNLITLHQRKCDEEKKKKKALLQLLLTGIVRIRI